MPGRVTPLITDQVYHVLNRGISFQPTFNSKRDFDRAIEVMKYYQNRKTPIRYSKFMLISQEERKRILADLLKKEDFLVEVVAYCLMPNHFHFILKQLAENGISNFMAHFTDSYTRYFNVKNDRNGPLFQGRFKAIRVGSDNQLLHLTRYIHLNPFSSFVVKTIPQLLSYRYSSFLEYLDKRPPLFCNKELVLREFKDVEAYREFVLDRADYQRRFEEIKHLLLEK